MDEQNIPREKHPILPPQNPPKSLRFLYNSAFGAIFLRLLTCKFISSLAGKYLDGRGSRRKIKKYIINHNIDMSQYMDEQYDSFNAFFTRHIKPELRPVDYSPEAFIAPCDGHLSVYAIDENTSFNIKGFTYTVESLLRDSVLAGKYSGGICLVFRLTVSDYHRYFYVDNGEKAENVHIKGRYHTVQPVALEKRKVFSENSREYTVLHTENFGDVTQVEVGAMMVGRIVNYHGNSSFSRGEEKGKFEFGGSTIVLLVEKDKIVLDEEFWENTENDNETIVRFGERLGVKQKSAQKE